MKRMRITFPPQRIPNYRDPNPRRPISSPFGIGSAAPGSELLIHYAVEQMRSVPGLKLLGDPIVRIGALAFTRDGHAPVAIAQALDSAGIAIRAAPSDPRTLRPADFGARFVGHLQCP
jgi:hypothetical protein